MMGIGSWAGKNRAKNTGRMAAAITALAASRSKLAGMIDNAVKARRSGSSKAR